MSSNCQAPFNKSLDEMKDIMEYYKIVMLALEELNKADRLNCHRTTIDSDGTRYCGSYHTTYVTYKGHKYNIDFHRHRWESPDGKVRAPKKIGRIKVVVQDMVLGHDTTWIEVYY